MNHRQLAATFISCLAFALVATVATAQAPTTIRAGETVTGRFSPSDPKLPDGSHYAFYRYVGPPGERIVITLRSDEVDPFMSWGRMVAGAYRVEASDDDSGGSLDSELEVTVGEDGDYHIRANTYAADETGAYRLSVRRVIGATPETGAVTPGRGEGEWVYAYGQPRSAALRPVGERIRQRRLLEGMVARLNTEFPLPRDVNVRMEQCGGVRAFYAPRENRIVFCYELVSHLVDFFVPEGEWTQKEQEAIEGAISFILMHEVGHALVEVLDLPITGREEDAVDQLATLLLLETGPKGTRAALSAMLAIQPGPDEEIEEEDYAGVHSLSPQRFYNVMCWIYATDPPRFGPLVSQFLPGDRMARCPGEYARFSRAWARLLEPHRLN